VMADLNGPTNPASPVAGQRAASAPGGPPAVDPVAVIRSRGYIAALVLAAILGIPISAIAYGFLALVAAIQRLLFSELPNQVFGGAVPAWWPVPWLVLCGLLTGLTIRYLPGNGGHSPAFGFKFGGSPPTGGELLTIVLAALTTLSLGAVLGPEAPLIAIGGGLAALTVRLAKKDAPPMALTIMASAGSFAAISTLLGSPVLGAFLIMEAAGIGGMTLSLVALPGLLASGIGALVFVGLDHWTGLGSFSLALTTVPPAVSPTLATMGWALAMGGGWRAVGMVDPLGRPIAASDRAPEPGAGHFSARPDHRPHRDGLPTHLRTLLHPGAVLRTGRTPGAGRTRRRLLGRRAGPAYCLQGIRLRGVAERVSWWPGFPVDVHRCRPRYCRQRLARHGPGAGDRNGHRRHVRRHAGAAAHLNPAGPPC
jgi:hypothetical protein